MRIIHAIHFPRSVVLRKEAFAHDLKIPGPAGKSDMCSLPGLGRLSVTNVIPIQRQNSLMRIIIG